MIPIRDEIRTSGRTWLTYVLIAVNVLVFLYETSLGEALDAFVTTWGLVPWNMTHGVAARGFSLREHVLPWLTSMFLHGGWVHLIGNMWFLHIFGDNVEDRLGRPRFVVLYVCGGLVAGLAQVVSSPGDTVPMVGASGAIAAVLGAYLLMYPRARVLTVVPIFIFLQFVRLPAFLFIGIWFVFQMFSGYAALLSSASGGVAWWAHIGGFVAGLLLCMVLKSGTQARPAREFGPNRYDFVRRSWS
jgi:membrane associated rhomboid family serine protease